MMNTCPADKARYLLIEPFYGGSHKQLIDLIHKAIPKCCLVTMTAKKWHWRSRVAALHFAQNIPFSTEYRVLFCSSVLNLAELVALRPDLAPLKKIIYFHENQLVYPVRETKDRDIQHGYNQILSCLVADTVIFNSHYNMDSFLSSINHFLHVIPDYRPKNLPDRIRPKCQVIYFPLYDQTTLNAERLSTSGNQEPDVKPSNHTESSEKISANQIMSIGASSSNQNQRFERLSANHSLGLSSSNQSQQSERLSPNQTTAERTPLCNQTEPFEGLRANENCESKSLDSNTQNLPNKPKSAKLDLSTELGFCCPSDGGPGGGKYYQNQPSVSTKNVQTAKPLHIVWAHRWEHDKDPGSFFDAVLRLHREGCQFQLSVLGEQFTDNLGVFETSRPLLGDHILHWGYLPSKAQFLDVLESADVVVSTALHEFFGVSMLEAVQHGCYPLCPNRLVYPEIYPKHCLYNTTNQLFKMLRRFCCHPELVRGQPPQVDISQFSWEKRSNDFLALFEV